MPEWPQADRRAPRLTSPTYAVRAPLARWLREQAADAHAELGRYSLLDVGCGPKPYFPFFEPWAEQYVGVDVPGTGADLEGFVEDLPVPDGSYDVILCSQVLEHCNDPARAVSELARATRSGGRVLASTHGVMVFHPSPTDYWRWTRDGLARLFAENGEWASVSVEPGSGTTACLAMLWAIYLDILADHVHLRRVSAGAVAVLNAVAQRIDAHVASLREVRPGALHANFHVVAVRA